MSEIYIISDCHFGHDNIRKYTNRPFNSVEEMNQVLVNNWNMVVNEDDVVYHLGDFSLRDIKIREREDMTTILMLEDTIFFVHSYRSGGFNSFKSSSKSMIDLLTDLQEKDQYTKTHSDRVFALVKEMALALGYHSKRIYNIVKAAHFHDLGKVFIDDGILNKPGKLTSEEFNTIEKHVPSKLATQRYNQPWVNRKIKRLSRQKKRALRRSKHTGKPEDLT